MSNKASLNPIALAFGSAFVSSLFGTTVVHGMENPFDITELASGYSLASAEDESDGARTKPSERKGVESKFRDAKASEGKCGEGKCGAAKASEGKCGEGKCGAAKASEGKCGEGKCGGIVMPGNAEFLDGDPCKINSNLPQCL